MHELDDLHSALGLAIHRTVRGFVDPTTARRGAAGLAPLLAMHPGTLANKANPDQEHQLGLAESVPLQLVSRDFSILYAYAQLLGHVAHKLPPSHDVGDLALLDVYCEMHAHVGVLAERIRAALMDGGVSAHEVTPIREAFDKLARAGLGVVARIEALAR